MIDKSLGFLVARLNRHLSARFPADGPLVRLDDLPSAHDAGAEEKTNNLLLTLVNIEQQRQSLNVVQKPSPQGFTIGQAPLDLHLYVLLSANFPDTYDEGLRLLSAALSFLQANPVFHAENAPDMPDGLIRLSTEMCSLDLQSLTNLWSNFGGRHLPSAFYKLRIVRLEEEVALPETPPITKLDVDLS